MHAITRGSGGSREPFGRFTFFCCAKTFPSSRDSFSPHDRFFPPRENSFFVKSLRFGSSLRSHVFIPCNRCLVDLSPRANVCFDLHTSLSLNQMLKSHFSIFESRPLLRFLNSLKIHKLRGIPEVPSETVVPSLVDDMR